MHTILFFTNIQNYIQTYAHINNYKQILTLMHIIYMLTHTHSLRVGMYM